MRLLDKRNGSREHHLPIIPKAEKLTFHEASQAVIDDCRINWPASLLVTERRIVKHLRPYFGHRRMAGITARDVTAYIVHRQQQGIVTKQGVRRADVSNGEVNRELATLKKCFNLALAQERIASKPTITLLQESAPRAGFFEPAQYETVLKHLPAAIRPVIKFAYHTGWRIDSEVLCLQWRNVDFVAGEVRIDPGAAKNREPRTFPLTIALRTLLQAQHAEHERLKKAGHLFPFVFFREVADERGGAKHPKVITSFIKAWRIATRAAGCPGRIPHDLRRTAIRNFVRTGVSQHVAMKLSGHKTPSVFQRYNIISDGDLREAARKLDLVRPSSRSDNATTLR